MWQTNIKPDEVHICDWDNYLWDYLLDCYKNLMKRPFKKTVDLEVNCFWKAVFAISNSLLYKEDFVWMKKQTLLRLNWVFHCIVLLMNKNKKKNRQCWMLWKQEYLSIVCKFVTEWKERFKWAIWKIIWNSKQFLWTKW